MFFNRGRISVPKQWLNFKRKINFFFIRFISFPVNTLFHHYGLDTPHCVWFSISTKMFSDPFEERLEYLQQRLTPQIRQKIRAKASLEKNTIAYNTVSLQSIYRLKITFLNQKYLDPYPETDGFSSNKFIKSFWRKIRTIERRTQSPINYWYTVSK